MNAFTSKSQRRLHVRPRGFAMGLFLVTLMVVTIATSTLVVTAIADVQASSRAAGRAAASALASSALEEFFAKTTYSEGFLTSLIEDPISASHPALGESSGQENWATLSGGKAIPCPPGYETDCYRVSVTVQRADSGAAIGMLVDVTARARCSGDPKQCQVVRSQQRLRPRQFFDYLFYTYYNTLSPSLYTGLTQDQIRIKRDLCDEWASNRSASECIDVAYLGQGTTSPVNSAECPALSAVPTGTRQPDCIGGPVYTADDWIVVCGDPRFLGPVYVHGPGDAGTPWKSASQLRGDTCYSAGNPRGSTPSFASFELNSPLLALPTVFTTADEARLIPSARVIPASAQLTFTTSQPANTRMSVNGAASVPLPASGVVVVEGDATVKGTVKGRLTVFATGKITIDGDLTYANGTENNTTDITSLVAGGGISILQPATASENRKVHALLMSLEEGVFTQGWDATPARWSSGQTPPTLELYGAVASRYQGVFGGYDAATGALINGYRKSFSFDDRPQKGTIMPPYLVSPTEVSWIRLDTTDVPPCSETAPRGSFTNEFCR